MKVVDTLAIRRRETAPLTNPGFPGLPRPHSCQTPSHPPQATPRTPPRRPPGSQRGHKGEKRAKRPYRFLFATLGRGRRRLLPSGGGGGGEHWGRGGPQWLPDVAAALLFGRSMPFYPCQAFFERVQAGFACIQGEAKASGSYAPFLISILNFYRLLFPWQ